MMEAAEWKLPNVREVPEYLVPAVLASVEKLNRRAARNGLAGFLVKSSEPYVKELRDPPKPVRYVDMVRIEVEGEPVRIPGWILQGRVDFEDGIILVNARPGAELPASYREARPFCDHCNSARQRKAIFVFESSDQPGRYMQVGRSCLQDFMGCSPESALWSASAWAGVFDDIDGMIDEDARGGGRWQDSVPLLDVMVASVHSINKFGFFSKAVAQERGVSPSSSDVSDLLFDPKINESYKPSDDEKKKAAAVVAWVLEAWGNMVDRSDYQHNAVQLCGQQYVKRRRIGLLVSLVAAYDRENEERVKREALVNAHVGEVGQRREFRAKYLGMNSFESAFGWMCIARFASPEGLLVYKGGNVWWPAESKAGDELVFVGSIKEHSDYKGMKQSMVARCVMGPAKVKAKASRAKKAA